MIRQRNWWEICILWPDQLADTNQRYTNWNKFSKLAIIPVFPVMHIRVRRGGGVGVPGRGGGWSKWERNWNAWERGGWSTSGSPAWPRIISPSSEQPLSAAPSSLGAGIVTLTIIRAASVAMSAPLTLSGKITCYAFTSILLHMRSSVQFTVNITIKIIIYILILLLLTLL